MLGFLQSPLLPRSKPKTIEVTIPKGKSILCPNCEGSGDDEETMICVMCGGDGYLGKLHKHERNCNKCEETYPTLKD
jgi:RecJ-like exonuclease